MDIRTPMGAARYVRKNHHSWPGGYALALVMDDGQYICPDCAEENFHTISVDVRMGIKAGWYPVGVACESETDDSEWCACCGGEIWEAKE